MSTSQGGPDPVDAYLSSRLRLLRTRAGMSRSALAERLGVSVQQLHKYEMGHNRIPAARLPRLASIFGAPIETFFPAPQESDGSANDPSLAGLAVSPEGRAITVRFGRIRDREARRALTILAEALARSA